MVGVFCKSAWAPTLFMIRENVKVDTILLFYKDQLGDQFDAYKNHVYRVFNFCKCLDPSPENQEKYMVAAIFHDLGIWTAKTFDYLKPSRELAKKYLEENKKTSWINEVELMIEMHHKRSVYRGDYEKSVEVFRKADWIDVTKGRKKFHLSSSQIDPIRKEFPSYGFHGYIIGLSIKNFFKNPLNPLPMFRK